MKQITKVKGISLIVLVITIIIIIILAGAVILSLSNSNVINKAKSGIMQTDIATVKEQIKTKMAENELNNINTKIGTQLWDSYYTMSVSQLQEIGITTKSDYIYNYDTGNLSVKQNNIYVTPEELYARDSAKNYIDGYVKLNFGDEAVLDGDITAATTPAIKTALQKQQLAQKSTNGEIKIKVYDVNLETVQGVAYTNAIENPKYETETTNDGYFIINDIVPDKTYYILISNFENTLPFYQPIVINKYINKTIFPKTDPLGLRLGDIADDNDYQEAQYRGFNPGISATDAAVLQATLIDTNDIKKYDFSKNGVVELGDELVVEPGRQDMNILMGNWGLDYYIYFEDIEL